MAIAKAGTDTSDTDTVLSPSFSHTLVAGSNRLVVVCIGYENADGNVDVTAVTYGGQTMIQAVENWTGVSTFTYSASIWYILEANLPADGARTINITGSGTQDTTEVNSSCSQYTGVAQSAPEATDDTVEASPGDDTIPNTISPSTDAWVISCVGCGQSGTGWAHGQSQSEILDFQDGSSRFGVAELRGASGETSLDSTFSTTANRMARMAASFAEAVVAGRSESILDSLERTTMTILSLARTTQIDRSLARTILITDSLARTPQLSFSLARQTEQTFELDLD